MKKIVMAVAAMMVAGVVSAQETASGSLAVTGTVESSITLTIESADGTTGGTGTNAATSGLGTITKFGAAPTGFTTARSASDYTLQGSIGIKVDKANLSSANFTLTAQLLTAAPTGVVYKVNGVTVGNSSPATVTATGAYSNTATDYDWHIVVANSVAHDTDVDNTINFTATSN